MLGYTREEICERGTNALDFKLTKELINESLFQKMNNYNPSGQREGEFKEYQKISFLKNNIKDIDEEKVEDFSLVLGKVLKWIQLALEIRCEDVVTRRDNVEYIKQDRAQAELAEAERSRKYQSEFAEKKAAFDETAQAAAAEAKEKEGEEGAEEAKPAAVFNEEEFKTEFDANNAEVAIVAAVPEEIDNDYDLAYKAPVMDME